MMKKYNCKFGNILTKKFLIKEYSKKEKSPTKIAKEVGCNKNTIWKYLKKYKIKTRTLSEATRGKNHHFFGKHHTKKSKEKMRQKKVGKRSNGYIDGRITKKYYCKDCSKEIFFTTALYGEGRCGSCSKKKLWQDKDFREKAIKAIFKGLNLKPNKPEKLLNKLLQIILPNEYKYVGDGEVIICGFNPDFINVNGRKKIIELYGNYWHNKPYWMKRDKRRLKTYTKYKYKTLIIWEHELKELEKLTTKIMEFNL